MLESAKNRCKVIAEGDFLVPGLFLSVLVHGIFIGVAGGMSLTPDVSVIEAPSSLEITVINQAVVTVIEEEIVTEEMLEEEILDTLEKYKTSESAENRLGSHRRRRFSREIVVSKRIEKTVPEKNTQPSVPSQESRGAITKAKPLMHKNPAPPYPRIARQREWEGIVRLSVFVGKEGIPNQVSIRESSGHGILDRAALKTVKGWKFSPAQSGSMRFSSKITIPIQFMLIKE